MMCHCGAWDIWDELTLSRHPWKLVGRDGQMIGQTLPLSLPARFLQNSITGQGLEARPGPIDHLRFRWRRGRSTLPALFRSHPIHPRQFRHRVGLYLFGDFLDLLVPDCVHGGLELPLSVGGFCVALGHHLLVQPVPIAVASRRKAFGIPGRSVPLDELQPDFFVMPADLGRPFLDISLHNWW